MITVATVVAKSPHAVERDLLCHRYRYVDLGQPDATELTLRQFVSFVLGAEPTSALGQAVNEGWTTADHLLANMAEQHAGLIGLTRRYPRPGLPEVETEAIQAEVEAKIEAERPVTATEVQYMVARGAAFDTFESPQDFQNKLAMALAQKRQQKARSGENDDENSEAVTHG